MGIRALGASYTGLSAVQHVRKLNSGASSLSSPPEQFLNQPGLKRPLLLKRLRSLIKSNNQTKTRKNKTSIQPPST